MSDTPVKADSTADAVKEQHAALGLDIKKHSVHTTHPEAQWFPKAGLGLFIHWGLASVHGNSELSWGMILDTPWDVNAKGTNKLAPETYWKLAEKFHPDRYCPDKWLEAAARAGFQYAVMTAMHHEGFVLWPSQYSEFSVRQYLGGRDLVGEYVEACRRHGLKVGLYYSPADWYFDREYMGFNWNKNPGAEVWASNGTFTLDQRHQPKAIPPKPANHDIIWRDLFHRRVEELLTRYGRLDLLWFDGGPIDNPLRDRARKLQPHLVINSRSCDGDYDCTECTLPDKPPPAGCWFETCDCWQDSGILSPWKNEDVGVWGYLARERYKSTAWMLERLARLRAWGSNYLINVGPRPDGELPRVVYERFAETAAWMKHSRASVIGASGCPKDLHCNAPVTCDSGHIYVHVLPGIKGEITLDPVKRPQSVRLMRTGANLSSSYNDRALRFSIPSDQRTDLVDVVVLEHQDRLI